jgi:hypothetical protein
MIGGRQVPNPKLAHLQNRLVDGKDSHANAAIAGMVMGALDAALDRAAAV